MDRLACVDLAAFPLQLLLRRQPTWHALPVAVIAEDKPQAPILWVNELARRARVLPGMRYAAGLSLARDLHAAVVSPQDLSAAITGLVETLQRFSPHVEPAGTRFGLTIGPGVFWLDASGLLRLYPSLQHWARGLRHALADLGYTASLAVGFTRFGTYALAKSEPGSLLCLASLEAEQQAAGAVALSRLELDPAARDCLARLGVQHVRDLTAIAPGDLRERFTPSVAAWQRLAHDALWTPLAPAVSRTPVQRLVLFDHAEADATRLLFLIKRELHGMLPELSKRHEWAAALELRARIDRHERYVELVRPAAPTLDPVQLLDLIRLRFEGSPIPGEMTELVLELHGVPIQQEQLKLFASRPRRDLDAANRALARLRAELGDDAVCRAVLREGHLPEASFTWQPLTSYARARPEMPQKRQLVRRIYARPLPLSGLGASPETLHLPDFAGPVASAMASTPNPAAPPTYWVGPYVLSGGWWHRLIQREYYFIETRSGAVRWCYRDVERMRWFLHGELE